MDDRAQVQTASGLNIIAGIWLIIAPFILGYGTSKPITNDIILGIIVGIVALIRVFNPVRTTMLSWINIIAGAWLIIVPFLLSYAYTTPRWNDVILGIIVLVLAIWSMGAGAQTTTHRFAH